MFKRITTLLRGFMGQFVGGLEKRNPEVLLEAERENLRKQISRYNEGLAAHAGLCERLMSQVKRLENEARELRARTTAFLRSGDRELAGRQALRLQAVQRELDENRTQLGDAEKTYSELLGAREVAVKAAQKKIEELKYALSDLKVKRATAELAEMASGMVARIGGAGDTLNRLQGMIEEEREKAAGRARVARDSTDTGAVHTQKTEQRALEELALEEFAAEERLSLPAPTPASEVSPRSTRPDTL